MAQRCFVANNGSRRVLDALQQQAEWISEVMEREIHYLTTDLDVAAPFDLEPLAAAFSPRGIFALHVTALKDGIWSATFETDETFPSPESNMAAMLTAIEGLEPASCRLWSACTRREFNLGYECGDGPRGFNSSVSAAIITRMATNGVSVRITLYPPAVPPIHPNSD